MKSGRRKIYDDETCRAFARAKHRLAEVEHFLHRSSAEDLREILELALQTSDWILVHMVRDVVKARQKCLKRGERDI